MTQGCCDLLNLQHKELSSVTIYLAPVLISVLAPLPFFYFFDLEHPAPFSLLPVCFSFFFSKKVETFGGFLIKYESG
jgi:hypothetical protein